MIETKKMKDYRDGYYLTQIDRKTDKIIAYQKYSGGANAETKYFLYAARYASPEEAKKALESTISTKTFYWDFTHLSILSAKDLD